MCIVIGVAATAAAAPSQLGSGQIQGRLVIPGVVSETVLPVPLPAQATGGVLSADGQRALVGAGDESAYVFVRSGNAWVQEAWLTGSDAQAGSGFGHQDGIGLALSADGSRALVGAALAPTSTPCPVLHCGAVYVFVRNGGTWTEEGKLQFGDPGPLTTEGVSFGGTVSLSDDGTTALGSAPFVACTGGGDDCGAIAIFRRSGSAWTLEQQIRPSDAAAQDGFGFQAVLSGDGNTALVSANGKPAVYIFTRSGTAWSQQAKLTNPDGGQGSFGYAVSLTGDGNLAAVSATGAPPCASALQCAGAVYLFSRTGATWTFDQKLTPADVTPVDHFGWSATLSRDGQTLLASSVNAPCAAGASCGKLYLFTRSPSGFAERLGFRASSTTTANSLGQFTALSGDGTAALAFANPCGSAGCGAVDAFTFAELAVVATPTLGGAGLLLLALALAVGGAALLRRRPA